MPETPAGQQPQVDAGQQQQVKMVKTPVGKSVYELPEGYQVHPSIAKGIEERDKHLDTLESENRQLREQTTGGLNKLNEMLSGLGSKPEEIPDPYTDPGKYAEYVEKRSLDATERRSATIAQNNNELRGLLEIAGNDEEKVKETLLYMQQEGWIDESGVIKKGQARAAYLARFEKDIMAAKEAEAIEKVKKTVADAQNGGTSLNSDGVGGSTGITSWDELRNKNPEEYHRKLAALQEREEADKIKNR